MSRYERFDVGKIELRPIAERGHNLLAEHVLPLACRNDEARMTKTKVVFLDRDGTLNEDRGYVHRIQDWRFTDRAVEAVRMLRDAGFAVALVSNQSGIARGLFTAEDVDELHAQVRELLVGDGADLDAVAYCPHGPDGGCGCRKPRPGLAREVERQLGQPIDYAASWTIGDKPADLGFGVALGTRTALLRSTYWSNGELERPPDLIAGCLYEAARFLLDGLEARYLTSSQRFGGPLSLLRSPRVFPARRFAATLRRVSAIMHLVWSGPR